MTRRPLPEVQPDVAERLVAELYSDGRLQVSISDDVLVEVTIPATERTDAHVRAWLGVMLTEVADAVPLQVEGRDFELGGFRSTS